MRSIQVPAHKASDLRASWQFDSVARRIVLEVPATTLSANLQNQLAASPSYLFCLGYWLDMDCLLRVKGPVPTEGLPLLHWNRAAFLINELESAADGRFDVEVPSRWSWPLAPILNQEGKPRLTTMSASYKAERTLELSLCKNEDARRDFSARVEEVGDFGHQLPLGLFEGRVSSKTPWTPGGGSQLGLWTAAADRETIHLFELKAKGNEPLGMLPQAIYYARLLHYLRVGLHDGRRIGGDCRNLNAIREAKRIHFWLAGPKFHPLLLSEQQSPIERLNQVHRGHGLEFSILPLEMTDTYHWSRWCWERRWPKVELPLLERLAANTAG